VEVCRGPANSNQSIKGEGQTKRAQTNIQRKDQGGSIQRKKRIKSEIFKGKKKDQGTEFCAKEPRSTMKEDHHISA